MKIQLLSDLHFEWHTDRGSDFLNYLHPESVDVLLIAGDLCNFWGLSAALGSICSRYKDSHVLYTPGNHEFYDSNFEATLVLCRKLQETIPNLSVLYNDKVVVQEQVFIGTPLWFSFNPEAEDYECDYNDFHMIEDFRSYVFSENKCAMEYLEANVTEGSIVITHFLPSPKCVSNLYKNSPLNPFFVCDMERLILEKKPKYWVHGHTHTTVNMLLGSTRILCNPLGYFRTRDLNPLFEENLIIGEENGIGIARELGEESQALLGEMEDTGS